DPVTRSSAHSASSSNRMTSRELTSPANNLYLMLRQRTLASVGWILVAGTGAGRRRRSEQLPLFGSPEALSEVDPDSLFRRTGHGRLQSAKWKLTRINFPPLKVKSTAALSP